MSLSLDRVLRFATVAEHMSFTRAAASLSMDQPWLSRQVMQLESQLGFALFDRNGPRISLTAEGREFLASVERLSGAAEEVRRSADLLRRRSQAHLKIGMSYDTYSVEGRTRLMNRYAALRPACLVDCTGYEWSDVIMDKLHAGEIEFGVVFGPVLDPDVEHCVLDHLAITVSAPAEDPLAAQPSIALADLAGRRIAVGNRDGSSYVYAHTYAWVEPVGAISVRVPEGRRFVFDFAERERTFVICFTATDKPPASFVQRPIHGPRPDVTVCLVRTRRVLSEAGEAFWRLAQELSAVPVEGAQPMAAPRSPATAP
jgi:DNA-binding transcriptional LysR family regulator